jgi:hypothetical protein
MMAGRGRNVVWRKQYVFTNLKMLYRYANLAVVQNYSILYSYV